MNGLNGGLNGLLEGVWSTGHFLFAFVLLLSVLIFVHEFGHFIVAKWCGVRVLKFSIGFGDPIGFGKWRLAWERDGTEYVIAWFPLGGFVKMLGENPDEIESPEAAANPAESLNNKNVWQKLAIVFAGPVVNLILPIFLYMGIFAVGMPRPVAIIGSVEAGSPGASAGLHAGDRILAVNGKKVVWWDEFFEHYRAKSGETLQLSIDRAGANLDVTLPIVERARLDEFGGKVNSGWLGVNHYRQRAMLGVLAPDAPAAQAGLHSGDLVTAVNDAPVEDWRAFEQQYAAATGSEVTLKIVRPTEGAKVDAKGQLTTRAVDAVQEISVIVPALHATQSLGVIPATVLVTAVTPEMPAALAGIQAGDLIVAVDGLPIGSFDSFVERVRLSEGKALALSYARAGITQTVAVQPKFEEINNDMGFPEPRYLVGILSQSSTLPGVAEEEVIHNPIALFARSLEETKSSMQFFLKGFGKLISGGVSHKQLAGPIGIAEIANKALSAGWIPYLSMMILISINLGFLNLIPIPVLDGGQAVLFVAEGIKGSPLSVRTKEALQTGGFAILMLMMGLAFWNDIARNWVRLASWFSGS